MAETTARHFLAHKSFTDRSFETLRNHLGGFTDDELRRILVRAGAIRVYRADGSEWWRLLSRMESISGRARSTTASPPTSTPTAPPVTRGFGRVMWQLRLVHGMARLRLPGALSIPALLSIVRSVRFDPE